MKDALTGFSSPSAWLVLGAMFISRMLRDTGLSRRIALVFVRRFGGTSLGVSYALIFSDVTLAGGIPSITARSGGIILPIARGVAELYDSHPGPSARILGTFLMAALYQASASPARCSSRDRRATCSRPTWPPTSRRLRHLVQLVPRRSRARRRLAALVVPYLVYRMLPPTLTHTPAAAEYARTSSRRSARSAARAHHARGLRRRLRALAHVGWHGLDVTLVAMLGISVLLVTGILTWETALAERSALGRLRLVRRPDDDGRRAEQDRFDGRVRLLGRRAGSSACPGSACCCSRC